MVDYNLKKVSEFVEAITTPFLNGFLDIIDGGVNKKLRLSQLRDDILDNAQLSGSPTAPTPNPGSDGNEIATTEYVQVELAGLGLDQATSEDYGTVRTNSTEAVPIVYTTSETYSKDEIDAIDATTRPINKGGTGATTAADARSNLSAAQSGNNNDITQLNALASIPAVVNTQLTSQSGRITTLEGQNLNTRLTSVEGVNTTQDTRLTNVESVNSTQNSRLTSLENNPYDVGVVMGQWTGLTTSNAGNNLLIGSGSAADPILTAERGGTVGSNTIISISPVSGSRWKVDFGMYGSAVNSVAPSTFDAVFLELLRNTGSGFDTVIATAPLVFQSATIARGAANSILINAPSGTYQLRLRVLWVNGSGTFTTTWNGVFIHAVRLV